jgi:hypothetical protein
VTASHGDTGNKTLLSILKKGVAFIFRKEICFCKKTGTPEKEKYIIAKKEKLWLKYMGKYTMDEPWIVHDEKTNKRSGRIKKPQNSSKSMFKLIRRKLTEQHKDINQINCSISKVEIV